MSDYIYRIIRNGGIRTPSPSPPSPPEIPGYVIDINKRGVYHIYHAHPNDVEYDVRNLHRVYVELQTQ